MTEALIFVVIGAGFLALLLRWVSRDETAHLDPEELSEASDLLASVRIDLPPHALCERIFAPQDWEYISTKAPAKVQRLFIEERKALAISWLRETRKAIGKLMEFHRIAVRGNINLSPSIEFRLALGYGVFLFSYKILCVLISLRGPVFARGILQYANSIAENMSCTSVQILGNLDPARFYRIQNSWAHRAATN